MQVIDLHSAGQKRIHHPGINLPTYSPAYPTALTRKGLLPGEVREVLQVLSYSIARCIRQYQVHGEPPRRTSAARLAELHAEANRLARCLGWIDVRKLDAHELHCIVQTCSSPIAGRMVLHLVLSHAARQGVIPPQRLRAIILPRSKVRANSKPDRQWSEQDWQTFRLEHGLPDRNRYQPRSSRVWQSISRASVVQLSRPNQTLQ